MRDLAFLQHTLLVYLLCILALAAAVRSFCALEAENNPSEKNLVGITVAGRLTESESFRKNS